MDNDDAIIGTIFTRRQAMTMAAKAGFALAMGGVLVRSARAVSKLPTTQPQLPLIVAPEMTEGPFFVDEKLNRSDLLAGTTRASVVNGLPLLLGVTIYKLTGTTYAPLKDVTVDLWHADTAGQYSDENVPMNGSSTAGEKWLRGYQTTSDDGRVEFSTIFPGWYNGRAPHIHFKVRSTGSDGKTREFTSQFFFHDKDINTVYAKAPYDSTMLRDGTRNADDDIYGQRISDGSAAGSHMLLDLAAAEKGYQVNFPVVLTDDSLRSGRRGFGGPGGPGGGPGGGPPDRDGGPGGPPDRGFGFPPPPRW